MLSLLMMLLYYMQFGLWAVGLAPDVNDVNECMKAADCTRIAEHEHDVIKVAFGGIAAKQDDAAAAKNKAVK